MRLSPNEVAWLTLKIGLWTPVDAVTGTAVAFAESGFYVDAMNVQHPPNVDLGLWQISNKWHGTKLQRYRWRDPYDCTRMARLVFDEFVKRPEADGWRAWTAYLNGAYLEFIDMATLAVQYPVEPVNPHTVAWRR